MSGSAKSLPFVVRWRDGLMLCQGFRGLTKAVGVAMAKDIGDPEAPKCWKTRRRLAEEAGCGQRTVYNAQERMQAAGWIVYVGQGRFGPKYSGSGERDSRRFKLEIPADCTECGTTCRRGAATVAGGVRHDVPETSGTGPRRGAAPGADKAAAEVEREVVEAAAASGFEIPAAARAALRLVNTLDEEQAVLAAMFEELDAEQIG